MTGEPPGFWRSVYSLFDLTDVVGDVQGTCHNAFSTMYCATCSAAALVHE